MNAWVRRGLQTALLAGGLLAVGTGVAAADENDVTAEVAGATATVPVDDGAVVDLPVVTGTGQDLAVTGADGEPTATLPVNTNTEPGTTVHPGDHGAPSAEVTGVSAPVRVVEADGTPAPDGSLAVTVPVNTSGGDSAAGTTIETSVVNGNVGDVLDGDPLTGIDVTVDLDDVVVLGPAGDDGRSVDVAPDPLVTIGDTDPGTTRDEVVEVPASGEAGEPSTMGLPARPGGDEGAAPLGSDNTVVLVVGDLVTDDPDAPEGGDSGAGDPVLSVPVDLGGLLPGDLLGESALSGNTVEIDLGDALPSSGTGGETDGSVITVPVNEGQDGLLGDNLVQVTLPISLPFGQDGDGDGGTGPGTGPGTAPGTRPGTGSGGGSTSDGSGSTGSDGLCTDATDASSEGDRAGDGTAGDGTMAGAAEGAGPAGDATGDGTDVAPCGIGTAAASRPAATPGQPGLASLALAGLLALSTAVVLATGRRRLLSRS